MASKVAYAPDTAPDAAGVPLPSPIFGFGFDPLPAPTAEALADRILEAIPRGERWRRTRGEPAVRRLVLEATRRLDDEVRREHAAAFMFAPRVAAELWRLIIPDVLRHVKKRKDGAAAAARNPTNRRVAATNAARVKRFFASNPEASDREAGRELGMSPKTIAKYRPDTH